MLAQLWSPLKQHAWDWEQREGRMPNKPRCTSNTRKITGDMRERKKKKERNPHLLDTDCDQRQPQQRLPLWILYEKGPKAISGGAAMSWASLRAVRQRRGEREPPVLSPDGDASTFRARRRAQLKPAQMNADVVSFLAEPLERRDLLTR